VERAPPLREELEEIVWGTVALHRQSPGLQQVLYEQAPGTEEIQAMLSALSERSSALIAAYLAKRSEVTASDTSLAARMLVDVLDAVTHRLFIRAPADGNDDLYARETVAMTHDAREGDSAATSSWRPGPGPGRLRAGDLARALFFDDERHRGR
jgi:hypothetical protein